MNEFIKIDNPKLQTINLGKYSLRGSESNSCSLSMNSMKCMVFL